MKNFTDDINFLNEHIFDICGYKMSQIEAENESSEYQAHRFKINNKKVLYRHAKITPTKIGAFVTIWKRAAAKKPIQPFDSSDDLDLFVVTVRKGSHLGQFIFSKEALIKNGILSIKGKDGKRALRIYPPWDKTTSKQAQKAQAWQLEFFAGISKDKSLDLNRFKLLYSA